MYRSIKIGKKEFEFSHGFEDLHTKSYIEILNGSGFGIDDLSPSLELTSKINKSKIHRAPSNFSHPLLRHLK